KRITAPIVALADSLKGEPAASLPPVQSHVSEVEDLRQALEDAKAEARRAELADAARREAEAANRAKDDFLAVLSHELRTPLNATCGWVRMLRSGRLDGAAADHALEVIERSVTQQVRLISDLLDASRIVFGRLELSLQSVDLPALVAGVVESIRPSAEIRAISLKSELDPDAGPVHGDADRLRQVVENILGNSIKFTPPNGAVSLQLVRNIDAHLIVSDTGRGIDAELLPHIFERFKQSDSASTREHAGLGLGLAIVRHLVELHGGRVHASAPTCSSAISRCRIRMGLPPSGRSRRGLQRPAWRCPRWRSPRTRAPKTATRRWRWASMSISRNRSNRASSFAPSYGWRDADHTRAAARRQDDERHTDVRTLRRDSRRPDDRRAEGRLPLPGGGPTRPAPGPLQGVGGKPEAAPRRRPARRA